MLCTIMTKWKQPEYTAQVDHWVIDNLSLRLAKNWGGKAKDISFILTGVTQAHLGLWPQIVSPIPAVDECIVAGKENNHQECGWVNTNAKPGTRKSTQNSMFY